MPITIDPATGERVGDSAAVQIDPATGERVSAPEDNGGKNWTYGGKIGGVIQDALNMDPRAQAAASILGGVGKVTKKISDMLDVTPLLKKLGVSDKPMPVGGPSDAAAYQGAAEKQLGGSPADEMGAVANTAIQSLLPEALAKYGGKLAAPLVGGLGNKMEAAGLTGAEKNIKFSTKLKKGINPPDVANLFKKYDLAPEGLASATGKEKTVQNMADFHNALDEHRDILLSDMPKGYLADAADNAVTQAQARVDEALKMGGDQAQQIGLRDRAAYQHELDVWKDEISSMTKNGKLPGENMKRLRGSLAQAATYDANATSNAQQIVAATIREEMNLGLNDISPEFRAIDEQFAETIPLRNGLADAIGREANKYPIGLRTAMVIASHGASIPVEALKIAALEGTSRFGPAVALKKAGQSLNALAAKMRGAKLPGEAKFYADKIQKDFGISAEDLDAVRGIYGPPEAPLGRPSDISPRRPTVALGDNIRRPLNPPPAPIAPVSDGLPPRRPTVDVPSNFPQKLTETPSMQRVIDQIPGRGDVIPLDEQIAAKKDLVKSTKGKEKLSHMRDLSKLNWKKSRGFKR